MPDLKWQEFETEDGKKGLAVSTDQDTTHTIAEGIIGECIANIKEALSVLWEYVEGDKPKLAHKFSEPTFHTIREELETALDMLESLQRKDIRPKHRDCRAVMKSASRVLAKNSPLNDVFVPETFLKDSLGLLSTMHMCLLEETKKKDRNRIRREYVNAAKKSLHA
tara:strand:+ start:173 stop:670 length:498 start_codon:yes stop_codon:yes gene_type:complete